MPRSSALQLAPQAAKSGSPRTAGNVRQLLLARVLVALQVESADLQPFQVASNCWYRPGSGPAPRNLGLSGAWPSGRQHANRLFHGTALRRSSRGLQSRVRRLSRIAPRYGTGHSCGTAPSWPDRTWRRRPSAPPPPPRQILDLHVLGQPLVNAPGQETHDGKMFEQHPLLFAAKHGYREAPAIPARSAPAHCALIPRRGHRFDPIAVPSVNRHLSPFLFLVPVFKRPQRTVPTGRRRISRGSRRRDDRQAGKTGLHSA